MLQQKLSHKMLQKLSPQQIQLMKLLQIPTATLDQRIKEELEANPALDEGNDYDDSTEAFDLENEEAQEGDSEDEFELDDYLNEYVEEDPISYKTMSDNYSVDEEDKKMPITVKDTFHEFLEQQLGMVNMSSDEERLIAAQVIGSIDSDGYLRRDTLSILDDLLFSQNIESNESEVEAIISTIQQFEPAGIGARSLQESLLLQLDRKILKAVNGSKRILQTARKILENHFEEFSKKHYTKLQKNLFITEEELKVAIDEIVKLNPKPASGYSGSSQSVNQYVVPDFIIENRDGELELTVNNKNAPMLHINDHYMNMLKSFKENTQGRRSTKKEREAVMFIKQKIDSAKWFIDAIKQRQDTLYRTMYSIMQYQYDYFLSGNERKLKPMILKDIADVTGLDVSTVSRVANSKFVQTEFGTKSLKQFFSESIKTKDGKDVSTKEVKNILQDIIDNENKKKPYSDEKLKNLLQDASYEIARRTVAKYREQLDIPVARLRKQL